MTQCPRNEILWIEGDRKFAHRTLLLYVVIIMSFRKDMRRPFDPWQFFRCPNANEKKNHCVTKHYSLLRFGNHGSHLHHYSSKLLLE